MKHLIIFFFVCTCAALYSQPYTENPISPAYQNMPEDVPLLIEYDWLFNTTYLPECKPSENKSKSGTENTNNIAVVTQDIAAYPNPNAVCLLNVDFEVSVPGSKLLLSGIDGTLLYSEDLGDFTGRYKKQLDLSIVPSTVVILTVIQNGVPSSQKIIVN